MRPASMLFHDGMKSVFPRQHISSTQMRNARDRDRQQKLCNQEQVNSSKFRQESQMKIGDTVLVRNYKRTSKFQPFFNPEQYRVENVKKGRVFIRQQNDKSGNCMIRHADDLKKVPCLSNSTPTVILPLKRQSNSLAPCPADIYPRDALFAKV